MRLAAVVREERGPVLIEAKASLDLQDNTGNTVLMLWCMIEREQLKECHARANPKNSTGDAADYRARCVRPRQTGLRGAPAGRQRLRL